MVCLSTPSSSLDIRLYHRHGLVGAKGEGLIEDGVSLSLDVCMFISQSLCVCVVYPRGFFL